MLLDEAKRLKEQGNELFLHGSIDEALSLYTQALSLLPALNPPPPPPFATPIVDPMPPPTSSTQETASDSSTPPSNPTPPSRAPEMPSASSSSPPASSTDSIPPAVVLPGEPSSPPVADVDDTEKQRREKEITELRAVLLNNRAACHLRLEHFEDCIVDATQVLATPGFEKNAKALDRRAQAQDRLGKIEEALADYKALLESSPEDDKKARARAALPRLEHLVAEKHEREKQELLGKLKEIGNTLLGKIGLSLDNFRVNKDPKTGGYSISFQKQ